MKRCCQCQQTKEDSEFYRDNRSEDLLTASCKECQKARAKERYRKIPLTDKGKERKAENLREWKSKNPDRYRELADKNNKKRKSADG